MTAVAQSFSDIAELAQADDPAVLGRVALMVGDICAAAPLADPNASHFVDQTLSRLVSLVAHDVRLRLAERLANVDWAPRDLIVKLAHDEVDIAGPVLRMSRVLTDADLIDVAKGRDTAHRAAIAERAHVPAHVAEALARAGEIEVISALVANAGATLSNTTMLVCIDAAADHEPLHAPLCGRAELSSALAQRLYAHVSDSLRASICDQFDLDRAALDAALKAALAAPLSASDAHAAALIDKLEDAGRLTPAVAVRAINDQRLDIFEHALARLAQLELEEMRSALLAGGRWATALACRAARIDRHALDDILDGLTAAGRLGPEAANASRGDEAKVFATLTPGAAAEALRRIHPMR